jgi:hypothetical protein
MSPADAQRLVAAIDQLTLQVSRVAYAIEEISIKDPPEGEVSLVDECRRCGCNLVLVTEDKCPVCKEPYVSEKPDGDSGVEAE